LPKSKEFREIEVVKLREIYFYNDCSRKRVVKMRETSYKKGWFGYFRHSKGKRGKSTAIRRNIVLGTQGDVLKFEL
jgi:hypothetical protein